MAKKEEEDFAYLQRAVAAFDFTDGFGDREPVVRAMTVYRQNHGFEAYEKAIVKIRQQITEFRLEEIKKWDSIPS